MVVYAVTAILVAIIVALCRLHYKVRCGRKAELIDKLPGPRALPLIGNGMSFIVPSEELWHLVRNMNNEYYPIYRIWSYDVGVVNIQHPDDVEALLSSMKYIEKSQVYKFLHPWLGEGLLTSTGAKWHERRKILTPAFHFNVLRQFVAIFVEQATQFVDVLKAEGGEAVHDVVPLVTTYTLNTICETAMGTSLDRLDETQKNKYRSCVHEMGELVLYRLLRPWLHEDWLFALFPENRTQTAALNVLHGFSKRIIKERRQYHQQTGEKYLNQFSAGSAVDDEDVTPGKKRLAMLDLMISAAEKGANLDDAGIREEVDTFVFEGHDTTAMALSFGLMLLAEHKDIQERARAEINEVLEESGGKMTYREIQRLSYLERCIKETLRLYPSVPFISRQTKEDLQLKKYLIPEGSIIHVHIFDLHRDANFWPNPDVFDPDRFLPEQIAGRHPYAFVPFSAGPRNCIGQKFAMLELKAVIGSLLHNFHLEAIDVSKNIRLYPDLVIRPAPGQPIRVKFIPIVQN